MSDSLNIQHNVDLQPYNTLAVPAVAQYFCRAHDLQQLKAALNWAKTEGVPVNILGGGSNVLLASQITGMVIQPALLGVQFEAHEDYSVCVSAGAGENWHDLVVTCTEKGYFGLENLALIPGNLGGAPIQNIGAYGVELKDIFDHLHALNIETLELVRFDKTQCQFDYRESVFKNTLAGQYIVVDVCLKLSKQGSVNISYPALQEALLENLKESSKERSEESLKESVQHKSSGSFSSQFSPRDVLEAVIDIRSQKLPAPQDIPNVGSFFKNPIIEASQFKALQNQFPDVVFYDLADTRKKLAAAWLIDQAGWKGRMSGEVGVHNRQALVLINPKRKGIEEIMQLAEEIERSVFEKFSVRLEVEPRYIA